MRIFRSCLGFTLIELMVTLALLGLVIAGGLSFYFFADRAFMSGSELADVQADMQLAMLRITEEVRLAHRLEVISEFDSGKPVPVDDPDDIHYLYVDDGSIFLKTKNFNRSILQADSGAGYSINFEMVEQDDKKLDNMLALTLSTEHPKVDYKLGSELQILNLRLTGIEGTQSGTAIRFTKDFSEEELEEAERINPGCPYLRYVYSPGAPELVLLREYRDNYLAKNLLGRFVIQVYYSSAPVVISLLEYRPLARNVTTSFLRSLAEVVIRVT
jgi:prepilin-type N-terminal cleavage/methylation domain-containing protein